MEFMTITECCFIFLTVAFVGASGAFIHAVSVSATIDRYWFERSKERHRKDAERQQEKAA